MRISEHTFLYYSETGECVDADGPLENPIPARAVEMRASSTAGALRVSGVGRVDWAAVQDVHPDEIEAFKEEYGIRGKTVFAGNTKTKKPRPGGRLGLIKGLALAPHFYANYLESPSVPFNGLAVAKFKDRERNAFNSFDGTTPASASEATGIPKAQLLNFCAGASDHCRATCLVLSGNNPASLEATRSKMALTNALLANPTMFVAMLNRDLYAFAKYCNTPTKKRPKPLQAVVRLNMLSDIPWYKVCPELIEEHDPSAEHNLPRNGGFGGVTFYDYTKVPFWNDPDYRRVAHLLDLTFSFSGTGPSGNTQRCVEALAAGVRIAAVFAPEDPSRRATVPQRTSWAEILASGLGGRGRTPRARPEHPHIDLFGGSWPLVDGDNSDFRVDDPSPCIVALNFKEPATMDDPVLIGDKRAIDKRTGKVRGPETYRPHRLTAALPGAREAFSIAVPTTPKPRKNPLAFVDAEGEALNLEQPLDMHPLLHDDGSETGFLIGPHVPTVLND